MITWNNQYQRPHKRLKIYLYSSFKLLIVCSWSVIDYRSCDIFYILNEDMLQTVTRTKVEDLFTFLRSTAKLCFTNTLTHCFIIHSVNRTKLSKICHNNYSIKKNRFHALISLNYVSVNRHWAYSASTKTMSSIWQLP